MEVSYGLLAETFKAAMSWCTEVYTLPLESIDRPTDLAFFVSEEPLDLGERYRSLVSAEYTIQDVTDRASSFARTSPKRDCMSRAVIKFDLSTD